MITEKTSSVKVHRMARKTGQAHCRECPLDEIALLECGCLGRSEVPVSDRDLPSYFLRQQSLKRGAESPRWHCSTGVGTHDELIERLPVALDPELFPFDLLRRQRCQDVDDEPTDVVERREGGNAVPGPDRVRRFVARLLEAGKAGSIARAVSFRSSTAQESATLTRGPSLRSLRCRRAHRAG